MHWIPPWWKSTKHECNIMPPCTFYLHNLVVLWGHMRKLALCRCNNNSEIMCSCFKSFYHAYALHKEGSSSACNNKCDLWRGETKSFQGRHQSQISLISNAHIPHHHPVVWKDTKLYGTFRQPRAEILRRMFEKTSHKSLIINKTNSLPVRSRLMDFKLYPPIYTAETSLLDCVTPLYTYFPFNSISQVFQSD